MAVQPMEFNKSNIISDQKLGVFFFNKNEKNHWFIKMEKKDGNKKSNMKVWKKNAWKKMGTKKTTWKSERKVQEHVFFR